VKVNIVVCVNHVPDTEMRVKVGPDGKTIDRTNVNYTLNPYDEFAIEESLRLKERFGGEVTALSLGGDSHKETLRKALSVGVDKAILLKDDSPRDSFAVAKALAETIKEISPEIIFFGKQSIDYDGSQVGTMVAEFLGLPSASVIVKLEISSGIAIAHREIEGGHEAVELKLPAVLMAQKGLNEPRYPSLKGIMAAKSRPIEERPALGVESRVQILSMWNPPPKNAGRIVGTGVSAVPELVRLLHEEAKVI
jgi:electron transfer flavoprotein beta subunit